MTLSQLAATLATPHLEPEQLTALTPLSAEALKSGLDPSGLLLDLIVAR